MLTFACGLFTFASLFHHVTSSTSTLKSDGPVDVHNNDTATKTNFKFLSEKYFLGRHGVKGKNYDVDDNNVPYIKCDFFNRDACDPAERSCPETVKCYATQIDHKLGCMAAIVQTNYSKKIAKDVLLKGCWAHGISLGEQCTEENCIANIRPTGGGNAAHFCCCTAHNCNREVYFRTLNISDESTTLLPLLTSEPALLTSDAWIVAIIILGIFIVCILVLICYWSYREFRNNFHYKSKASNDVFSLPATSGDKESLLLDKCMKEENGKDIEKLELVAYGKFGRVFRGLLNGSPVAVKVFPASDVNSWVVEQEVYAIKALKNHENILHCLGAEVRGSDYWLITEYHENGSLYDFLKVECNRLSLYESLKVISTMLKGLAFLHEERTLDGEKKPCIVHRDFKSRNILLKSDLCAVVADFGLALKCENGNMPSDENHGQVGTRRYMSPEILEGATEFTAFAFRQIDVYAAALVVWEALLRTVMNDDDQLEPYRQPYEDEAGQQPTLHDLRRVVAVMKRRPQIREAVTTHTIGSVMWKTVEDMWDMEPDGRITAGCAFERVNTLYSLMKQDIDSSFAPSPPTSGAKSVSSIGSSNEEFGTRPALHVKDGSLSSNGFNTALGSNNFSDRNR